MNFWDSIKKDLQKGWKEGMAVVKEGATYVQKKAGELTDEGKKQYQIFELKAKVQREITELGGKVYDASKKMKNPMLDSGVKAIAGRLQKLEDQIAGLEGTAGKTAKKAVSTKKTVKKKTVKKSSAKKKSS